MADYCEHGNGDFVSQISDYQLVKKGKYITLILKETTVY